MPTVRTYKSQQPTAPVPGARKSRVPVGQVDTPLIRATPSAASFGAELGGTLARAGSGLLGIELDAQLRERAKQDEERVSSAEKTLLERLTGYLHHPQTGVLNTALGERAKELPDKAGEFYRKTYGEILGGLNPEQQPLFERLATRHQQNFTLDIYGHAAKETDRVSAADHAAKVDLEAANAILAAGNPGRVGQHIAAIDAELERFATNQGLPPAWFQAKSKEAHSSVWSGVIRSLMAQDNAPLAKALFFGDGDKDTGHQDEILPEARAQLEPRLRAFVQESTAARISNAFWLDLGPKIDTERANARAMIDAARTAYAEKDPKLFEAIENQLKDRVNIWNDAVKEQDDTRVSTVWRAVEQGISVEQLRRMPEFQSLDGKEQAQVSEHVIDRGYSLSQRAKSAAEFLADQRWQTESRARSRKEWEKRDKDEASYARYEELLSDPEAFAAMSENAIIRQLPDLGRTLMNDLLTRRKALTAEKSPSAANIDVDVLNQVAEDAGLEPFKTKKTTPEKARLGALRKYIEDRIDEEQRANANKPLSRERKQEIAERAVIEIIPAQAPWFGWNTPARRAFEIEYKDIPVADQTRIGAYLLSRGEPVDQEAIRDAYIYEQQRKVK